MQNERVHQMFMYETPFWKASKLKHLINIRFFSLFLFFTVHIHSYSFSSNEYEAILNKYLYICQWRAKWNQIQTRKIVISRVKNIFHLNMYIKIMKKSKLFDVIEHFAHFIISGRIGITVQYYIHTVLPIWFLYITFNWKNDPFSKRMTNFTFGLKFGWHFNTALTYSIHYSSTYIWIRLLSFIPHYTRFEINWMGFWFVPFEI